MLLVRAMTTLRHLFACALFAPAVACGTTVTETEEASSEPDPTPVVTEPSGCQPTAFDGGLEIGTGETCFTSVAANGNIALIAGGQGGYHMWIALRCRHCAGAQLVRYGVIDDSTGAWVMGDHQQEMVDMLGTGDYFEIAGIQAPMPGDSFSEDTKYLGATLRLWIEMNVAGETVEREVTVVADHIEYWWPPCENEDECFG